MFSIRNINNKIIYCLHVLFSLLVLFFFFGFFLLLYISQNTWKWANSQLRTQSMWIIRFYVAGRIVRLFWQAIERSQREIKCRVQNKRIILFMDIKKCVFVFGCIRRWMIWASTRTQPLSSATLLLLFAVVLQINEHSTHKKKYIKDTSAPLLKTTLILPDKSCPIPFGVRITHHITSFVSFVVHRFMPNVKSPFS